MEPSYWLLYWREKIADLNLAFGWTDEYILSLSSGEIITKIFEIRKQRIIEAVSKLEAYGEIGIDQLEKLENYNPVKRYWMKKRHIKVAFNDTEIEQDLKVIGEFMRKFDAEHATRH